MIELREAVNDMEKEWVVIIPLFSRDRDLGDCDSIFTYLYTEYNNVFLCVEESEHDRYLEFAEKYGYGIIEVIIPTAFTIDEAEELITELSLEELRELDVRNVIVLDPDNPDKSLIKFIGE